MKNFCYSFSQLGTLIVWLATPDKKPELLALVTPAFNKTGFNHTTGWGSVSPQPDMVNADGVPVIIECLLNFQQYYSQN
jgi:hypothetical protein